jgi:hypothetical protein
MNMLLLIILLFLALVILIILNHIENGSTTTTTNQTTTTNSTASTTENPVSAYDNIQGTCADTHFGCCPDGINSKDNIFGSNCPSYKETQ